MHGERIKNTTGLISVLYNRILVALDKCRLLKRLITLNSERKFQKKHASLVLSRGRQSCNELFNRNPLPHLIIIQVSNLLLISNFFSFFLSLFSLHFLCYFFKMTMKITNKSCVKLLSPETPI